MTNFSGKRVLITGGSGGIGTETARQFLDAGAYVMLVDINGEDLKKTKEKLDSDRLYIHTADVTKSEEVQAYVKEAKAAMGGIDVFFNNAGIEGPVMPIVDYPEEAFHKVIHVNILGVYLGLKYVMKEMADGGSIIITSSVAGHGGTPNMSGYVTSKHAVIGLMKVAALEGAASNIRVNTVHPSPVDNRMMRSIEDGFGGGKGDAVKSQFESQIPLGRYASENDVAKLVLFLAGDDATFLTGGQYSVDGGMSAL
ncbi:SDR family oxidoreductase [Neolewinella aurantiaca]|uniref:SDR family oxidoreductase n=1 Tax=Neolewinella aurantiaca TaxID=2602767 RepID=A0A5C7FA63_9BACT|nr:SDR family oxidoreductase [Neolewinella aurantiaca]TXF87671.1 SDR family oxidoreductase [Neolewinella aurantiaca]